MSAFYGILAIVRFFIVLCIYKQKNHKLFSNDTEKSLVKLCGLLLVVLSFVLATVCYINLSQIIATKHDEIIMITIATYTFCKISMAIIKTIKQRKEPSLLLITIRSISYAEAAASILTLQRSMLVSFGSMNSEQACLMNSITGVFVCLFILILGISTIMKSTRKDFKLWQNQNS